MRPDELAAGIDSILRRSSAVADRLAGVLLVANPRAGGFSRPKFAHRRRTELARLMARAETLPLRPDSPPFALALTDRAGHAAAITRDYVSRVLREGHGDARPHLLMTAGGDGTSLELVSTLMELDPAHRSRFLVLRLPFGTGNDGAEGRDLISSLGRLLGPLVVEGRPAIRCSPAAAGGKPAFWSFNIASFGLDAFVADMTNRLKSTFPGDSYLFWVNLAAVLYDRLFRVAPMSLRAWNASGEAVRDFRRPLLLLAVGASGNRQYGSDKRILPDEANVCAISQTGLLTKLGSKAKIERGLHRGLPIVELFEARRLVVEYAERVLFQMDGEVIELGAADFPFTLDIEPDSYNVLGEAGV